ncbi:hypothetical protein K502DRAFT_211567 [Neoconidiobolus thromboides FSU 785]|nr:hypothetical protein K502DRAFT_211567 [Neoconidiobolus thromboides FSU 785]
MLFEIRKENCDLNTKNNQLESTLSILKGKEKIMDQKVMFHQGHSDYLQKELDNKINEFSEYRVQKSTEITMLGSQNEMLQKNIRDLMSDKEILNTKVEKLSGQVKVEEEKIMELNKAASENETNYKKDLSENLLMSDFYQTKANNADERVQTLEEKLEKAETALREIKSEKEDIKGRYEFNEKEMKEKLSTLERQIEVYENHHEALEQLDPSSEIGSFNLNLVDPKSGKPYVKMISDFYILESKLKSEEENCLKLKEMLDILVKEYELKALDYENVERYSEELLIKLDRALTSEKRSTDQLKETYQKYEDLTMECIYIKDKVDKLEIIRRFYENQIEVLSQNTKIDESIGEQYHANTTLQPGDTNSNAIRLWGDNEMQNVLGNNFKLIRGDDEVQDRGTKCDNNLTEMEIQNILKINQELKIQVANETQRLSDAQKEIRELKKVANKDYDSSICNDMDESEDENENLQMDESNPELIDVDFNKSKKAHNEKIEFLNKQIDKMAAEINIKTESIAHLEASLLFAEVQNKTKASQYETIIEEAAELKVKVDSLKDEVKEKDERYYKLNENFDKIRTQIAGDKTMLSESTIEIELKRSIKLKQT